MNNHLDIYGLTDRDRATIDRIFSLYPEVRFVHLFGSRAKGTSNTGSDIDLAIMNSVESKVMRKLNNEFEESSLPYKVDLVDYNSITNPDFIDHINRVGIAFYTRDSK